MKPTFNSTKKYRAIQSSDRGTVVLQGGHVFDERGIYKGPAPVWGPDLFVDADGKPIDAYAKVLAYAEENYKELPEEILHEQENGPADVIEMSPLDEVEESGEVPPMEDPEGPKVTAKPKRGRPRKGSHESGHGSGTL